MAIFVSAHHEMVQKITKALGVPENATTLRLFIEVDEAVRAEVEYLVTDEQMEALGIALEGYVLVPDGEGSKLIEPFLKEDQ